MQPSHRDPEGRHEEGHCGDKRPDDGYHSEAITSESEPTNERRNNYQCEVEEGKGPILSTRRSTLELAIVLLQYVHEPLPRVPVRFDNRLRLTLLLFGKTDCSPRLIKGKLTMQEPTSRRHICFKPALSKSVELRPELIHGAEARGSFIRASYLVGAVAFLRISKLSPYRS